MPPKYTYSCKRKEITNLMKHKIQACFKGFSHWKRFMCINDSNWEKGGDVPIVFMSDFYATGVNT